MEKRGKGKQYHLKFPMTLKLLGRISSGEEGKEDLNLEKKIKTQDFEKLGWGRI